MHILQKEQRATGEALSSAIARMTRYQEELQKAETELTLHGLKAGEAWSCQLPVVTLEQQEVQYKQLVASDAFMIDGEADNLTDACNTDAEDLPQQDVAQYPVLKNLPCSLQKEALQLWQQKRALKYEEGACNLSRRFASHLDKENIRRWEDRYELIKRLEEQQEANALAAQQRRAQRQAADADVLPARMRVRGGMR